MAPNQSVFGTVDVRDGTDVDGLTVELWDAAADVPVVGVPYQVLRAVPGVVRQRLGDSPVAVVETDTDGRFDADVDDPADDYHVRVFQKRTYLGSVDVRSDDSGGGNRAGNQQSGQGGQQPPQGGPSGSGVSGGAGGSGLSISVAGKAGGLGLAGLAAWYVLFRDEDDEAGQRRSDDNDTDNAGTDSSDDDTGGTVLDDDTGENTGDDTTGDDNTGDDTTGDDNTGDDTTGEDDTGSDEQYNPRDAENNQVQAGEDRPSFAPGIEDQARQVYAGADSRQEGVDTARIRDDLVSIVSGEVVDRNGDPVADVRVRMNSQSANAFGQTRTDENGTYELALNGGNFYTFNFEKEGYLPVQRRRRVAAKDHHPIEEVVLVDTEEASSTNVTMDADEAQALAGSENTDGDGSRTGLLVVPPGTSGGYEEELTFRSLEYTVGDRGPESMPAELPSRTGYTYAVEYNASESDVPRPFMETSRREFNQPVIHYNDNFLGFPVGSSVPTGLYSRSDARWEPSSDGRVVEILDTDGGTATLDVDGDGQPATEEQLTELGVADGELEQLAAQYDPGTQLWRTPVPHFTPVDCNWPFDPPFDELCGWLGL